MQRPENPKTDNHMTAGKSRWLADNILFHFTCVQTDGSPGMTQVERLGAMIVARWEGQQ